MTIDFVHDPHCKFIALLWIVISCFWKTKVCDEIRIPFFVFLLTDYFLLL